MTPDMTLDLNDMIPKLLRAGCTITLYPEGRALHGGMVTTLKWTCSHPHFQDALLNAWAKVVKDNPDAADAAKGAQP